MDLETPVKAGMGFSLNTCDTVSDQRQDEPGSKLAEAWAVPTCQVHIPERPTDSHHRRMEACPPMVSSSTSLMKQQNMGMSMPGWHDIVGNTIRIYNHLATSLPYSCL